MTSTMQCALLFGLVGTWSLVIHSKEFNVALWTSGCTQSSVRVACLSIMEEGNGPVHYSYKMTAAINFGQDEQRNLNRNNPRDVKLPCS